MSPIGFHSAALLEESHRVRINLILFLSMSMLFRIHVDYISNIDHTQLSLYFYLYIVIILDAGLDDRSGC